MGLGARTKAASFLVQVCSMPHGYTWPIATVYRWKKRPRKGWWLVQGHIAHESYDPYRPPPPQISAPCTLLLKTRRKEASHLGAKPSAGSTNLRGNLQPQAHFPVLSVECLFSTTSQCDFHVSYIFSQTVCSNRKCGQWSPLYTGPGLDLDFLALGLAQQMLNTVKLK